MKQLKQILLAPVCGPAELTMAITMLAYGLPLLLPPEEFARYPVYGPMAKTAPEVLWGGWLVLVALWRTYAVLFGSLTHRKWATAVSLAVWISMCSHFVMARPSSPAVFVLGAWVILESWTVVRIQLTH